MVLCGIVRYCNVLYISSMLVHWIEKSSDFRFDVVAAGFGSLKRHMENTSTARKVRCMFLQPVEGQGSAMASYR